MFRSVLLCCVVYARRWFEVIEVVEVVESTNSPIVTCLISDG